MLFNIKNKGFTMVEMMIALTVFSVVILLTSAIVSGLSKQYQKAVYSARLNDASRTVHTLLGESISYSSTINITNIGIASQTAFGYFCAGDNRYYWHKQTGTTLGTSTGLYRDATTSGVCVAPDAATEPTATTENLLPPNGFVTDFTVGLTPGTSIYKITTVFNVGTVDMFSVESSDIANSNTVCLPTLRGGDYCAQNKYDSIVVNKVGSNI